MPRARAQNRPSWILTDFTGGELSPRWFGRTMGAVIDPQQGGANISDQYAHGCVELTNLIVMPQGGVAKRQALRWLRDITADLPVGVDTSGIRVFNFEYPGADFLTVWCAGKVLVYSTATLDVGVPLPAPVFTAVTPYSAADVKAMQVVQTHNGLTALTVKWRLRLLRYSLGVWSFQDTISDPTLTVKPPVYDFNDTKSPPASSRVVTMQFTIANRSFTGRIKISGTPVAFDGDIYVVVDWKSTANTRNSIETFINSQCSSVRPGTLVVLDLGGYLFSVEYKFAASVGDGTGDLLWYWRTTPEGVEAVEVLTTENGSSGAEPLWSGPGYVKRGTTYYQCILKHVAAAANEPGVGAQWTTYWVSLGPTLTPGIDWTKENATNELWVLDASYGTYDRGWPSAGTMHEQRLVLNGPPDARAVVAGSRTGYARLLDFTLGVYDDDGFLFTIAAANGLSVTWLHSQKLLYVGTSVGMFLQTEVPLTPTAVGMSRQSNYSMGTYRAFDVAGEVFFVQRNGRQMRRAQYVNETDSWQAADITSTIEHLFSRRPYYSSPEQLTLVDQAYQNSPDSILWMLRSDGGLLSLTYDKYYRVAAWAKHTTRHGKILALESYFGGVAGGDSVAMLVLRTSADSTTICIEVLPDTTRNETRVVLDTDRNWKYETLGSIDWPPYLDSTHVMTGTGSSVLTGLPTRFAGLTVDVVENGVHLGTYPVSGDALVLNAPSISGSRIFIGFDYPCRLRPTKIEGAVNPSSQAAKIRWVMPHLRLYASQLPIVNGQRLRERGQGDVYDAASGLYTGDIPVTNLGHDGELIIETTEPLPFQLNAVFGIITAEGG